MFWCSACSARATFSSPEDRHKKSSSPVSGSVTSMQADTGGINFSSLSWMTTGIKSNFLAASLKGFENEATGAKKSEIKIKMPWRLITLDNVSKHRPISVPRPAGSKATSSRMRRKTCFLPFWGEQIVLFGLKRALSPLCRCF